MSSFVRLDSGYLDDFITCDKLKEIAWANIKYCRNCGGCAPGASKTISGSKEAHDI